MDAGLPLKVHTQLPRRSWDWKFDKLEKTQTVRPANQVLLETAEQLRAAYATLLASPEYTHFTDPAFTEKFGQIDPLILPFIAALSRIQSVQPWQSCQGLYHMATAGVAPHIDYHPISGTQEQDLAKVAHFLRDGPQDTYYPWEIVGRGYCGRLVLSITIPGLEMDPNLVSSPRMPSAVALHPLSETVHSRVVKDVNSLTLGFLLFQEVYGQGLEGFPPPGYYS
ncbi:MAG: hypothetical protein NT099_07670 [Candidatus Saganbacteria bacterium]|nr:hypothetical protein [Candidatus Saganbacteria bacterium]